jgi:hypothetical protein
MQYFFLTAQISILNMNIKTLYLSYLPRGFHEWNLSYNYPYFPFIFLTYSTSKTFIMNKLKISKVSYIFFPFKIFKKRLGCIPFTLEVMFKKFVYTLRVEKIIWHYTLLEDMWLDRANHSFCSNTNCYSEFPIGLMV